MWEESFRITTKEEITLFRGKKYKDSAKLVDRSTQYEVPAAMDLVVKTASAKFDETVEVHIKLGVDSRHADQQVRGAIVLPNGTGKTSLPFLIFLFHIRYSCLDQTIMNTDGNVVIFFYLFYRRYRRSGLFDISKSIYKLRRW